jgi:4a-hydroxytetrahydrobiopterin dehydratase
MQDDPMNQSAETVYNQTQSEARLARELPHWRLENGCIARTYKTANWKSTLLVVNTIGHLAEAAWHHPDLHVAYGSVTVLLHTHSAKGITDKDFELAKKIEEVIAWQPGKEAGALEGTPQGDERYAYIRYE